jgi:hypothetical protein
MTYLVGSLIVWMVVGAIIQLIQYKKGKGGGMDVVHFYELSPKWYTFYPLWAAVAWPMIVYYWIKTK